MDSEKLELEESKIRYLLNQELFLITKKSSLVDFAVFCLLVVQLQ